MRVLNRQSLVLLAVLCAAVPLGAQTKPATLTGQDYAEIEQLSMRYARGFDSGNGELFARAFTADGVLNLGRTPTEGREKLAEFGGRPRDDKGPAHLYHVVANVLIEPTPQGASGVVYTLLMNLGHEGKPAAVTGGFIYNDSYVKGPEGWRIKTRIGTAARPGQAPAAAPPAPPSARQ